MIRITNLFTLQWASVSVTVEGGVSVPALEPLGDGRVRICTYLRDDWSVDPANPATIEAKAESTNGTTPPPVTPPPPQTGNALADFDARVGQWAKWSEAFWQDAAREPLIARLTAQGQPDPAGRIALQLNFYNSTVKLRGYRDVTGYYFYKNEVATLDINGAADAYVAEIVGAGNVIGPLA